MNRRRIFFALILLVLTGTFQNVQAQQISQDALNPFNPNPPRMCTIVVAGRNICEGEPLDAGNLVEKQIRTEDAQESVVESIEFTRNSYAAVQISKGHPILLGHLTHLKPPKLLPWSQKQAEKDARSDAEYAAHIKAIEKAVERGDDAFLDPDTPAVIRAEIKSAENDKDPTKEAVVVAYKDIAAGELINEKAVTMKALKRDTLPRQAIRGRMWVLGAYTARKIKKGEVLTDDCLSQAADRIEAYKRRKARSGSGPKKP